MKLTVDFSGLFGAVKQMGAKERTFELSIDDIEIDPIDIVLQGGAELGKDIHLEDIEHDNGVLSYRGRQVMLYIPEQYKINETLEDGANGRRIHLAECSTLEQMRSQGKFPRYQVTNELSGKFPVHGKDYHSGDLVEGKSNLKACMNCLKVLNYKGYTDKSRLEQKEIFSKISFLEFFETYSSFFHTLPPSTYGTSDYVSNWRDISNQYRKNENYTCQQCGVNLNEDKKLLHVHHINGVKSDNTSSNLKVLCADCHKKQPHHGHLPVKHADVLTINRLRREQHKSDVSDYSQLSRLADTALEGLIYKCKATSLPVGEVGIAIKVGAEFVSFDLAWPRKKIAILILSSEKSFAQQQGWTIFSPNEALQNFPNFQACIR